MALGELFDGAAVVPIHSLWVQQCHGVSLDLVGDDELQARESDTVGGQAPPSEGGGRVGEVEHHTGPGGRKLGEIGLALLVGQQSRVDPATGPLGAGDGRVPAVAQYLGGPAGADDGGDAEFAADDGSVRGPAPMVGNDRGSLLHDGFPVGVSDARDKHPAGREAVEIHRRVEDNDRA